MIEYKIKDLVVIDKSSGALGIEGLSLSSNPIGTIVSSQKTFFTFVYLVELSSNTTIWVSNMDIIKVLPNGKLTESLYL